MHTVALLLKQGSDALQGIDNPRLEAELLLCAILHCDRIKLITWPEDIVNDEQKRAYQALLERRVNHEPLAYIIGTKEFWSMPFKVTPHVLVPRPETELLVETVLSLLPNEPLTVLELGTGSGAIACALASERPNWQIVATDISKEALSIATENAAMLKLHNIQWLGSDWFTAIPSQTFAAIISNPPYLANDDPHLHNDLLYEPHNALVSGISGLEAYEAIITKASDYLERGGLIAFEHGFTQSLPVRDLLEKNAYNNIKSINDLNDVPRVTYGRMKK